MAVRCTLYSIQWFSLFLLFANSLDLLTKPQKYRFLCCDHRMADVLAAVYVIRNREAKDHDWNHTNDKCWPNIIWLSIVSIKQCQLWKIGAIAIEAHYLSYKFQIRMKHSVFFRRYQTFFKNLFSCSCIYNLSGLCIDKWIDRSRSRNFA